MTRQEMLLWAMLVLDVLGFGGLIYWMRQRIGALEAVVATQTKTLDTVNGLNRIVLEVIQALDPERWAKEVKVHKELADQKVEALIESERRERQKELQTASAFALDVTKTHINDVFELLPYIPQSHRAPAIAKLGFDAEVKKVLYTYAEQAPEYGVSALALMADIRLSLSKIPAPHSPPDGPDLTPPPAR